MSLAFGQTHFLVNLFGLLLPVQLVFGVLNELLRGLVSFPMSLTTLVEVTVESPYLY